MNRRRIAFTLLLALLSLPVTGVAETTPDADRLAEQLRAHAPTCGHFSQHRWMADLDTGLDSTGIFRRQGEALIWQTLTPVSDRVRLAPDNPDLPLGLKAMLPVLTGLLAGDWQAVDQHFRLRLEGQQDAWQARLTPRDAAVAERLTGLRVAGGERVERVRLDFRSGDHLELTLEPVNCDTLDTEATAS
ncbi:LolA-related protein [Halomonas sp. THAF12]|uniref:LolA-related protein n=1 Tax=Halomonas sp. B23F22_10 TaxID=3459515 RepID=UPI00373EBB56